MDMITRFDLAVPQCVHISNTYNFCYLKYGYIEKYLIDLTDIIISVW